jgi:hypothetical protein
MTSPLNPTPVPVVTYEYLIYLPSGEWPGHPLDGRLGSYCHGLVPWVPIATCYGSTNLDMTQFPPAAKQLGNQVCHSRTNPGAGHVPVPFLPRLNTPGAPVATFESL